MPEIIEPEAQNPPRDRLPVAEVLPTMLQDVDPEHVREYMVIRGEVSHSFPDADLDLLDRAFLYAYQAHRGQRRISGEPYIIHSIAVAKILADLNIGDVAVAAGLLHDVVEDTHVSVDEIRRLFGDTVGNLVDGVTKIPKFKYELAQDERKLGRTGAKGSAQGGNGAEILGASPGESGAARTDSIRDRKQAENFHKMLLSMSQDLRVILIKFADRLHNMRTIGYLPRQAQERIARETLDVFSPLAHRLGVHQIKWELEDLAFKVLEQRTYRELAEKVAMKRGQRERLVQQVIDKLQPELERRGIKARVMGRAKHLYSIHNKIQNRSYSFEDIADLLAVRVIVEKNEDCYHALGVIHSMFTPIEGKFTDYIAMPKSNMYQSLHTKVFGPEGFKVEVQIRTEAMNRTAEIGIAAHWRYKEGGATREELDRQMDWLRSLLESRETKSPAEFLQDLKIDLYQEEIFVCTPKGRLISLPRGATPIDFAFAVHTDIGLHAMAAKVNGQITPLRSELKSGDIVEIITSPTQRPNLEWLQFVKTGRAQSKIKKWLKEQHFEESAKLGREILVREFNKYHVKKTDKELEEVALLFGHNELKHFLAAVGTGDVSVQSVLRKVLPVEGQQDQGWGAILSRVVRRVKGSESGVRIQGMQNVAITFGRCCQPLPGDRITGFITTGRGVSVHRVECRNIPVLMQRPERNIAVEWDVDREAKFNVRIRVIAKDRSRLLNELTSAMAKEDINILYLEMKREDNFAIGHLTIEVKSLPHLTRVFKRMSAIKDVIHVERLEEDLSQSR